MIYLRQTIAYYVLNEIPSPDMARIKFL